MACNDFMSQLLNDPNVRHFTDRLLNTDWNHWKLQFQSFLDDAMEGSNEQQARCPRGSCDEQQTRCPKGSCDEFASRCGEKKSNSVRVKNDGKKFEINLDVKQFSPDDISVKTSGNHVIVVCNHKDKKDEYGWISRHLTRRFPLPDDVEAEEVTSFISADGILIIEAPKKVQQKASNERIIPIQRQGNQSSKKYDWNQTLD